MVTPRRSSMKDSANRIAFDRLKYELPVGIYGSFYPERKNDLILLRDHLRCHGYGNACISDDFDERPPIMRNEPNPKYDRELSNRLIYWGVAHIFVLAMPKSGEPANLIQSVSMELERLATLMDHGIKRQQEVMLLIQDGLTDCIPDSAGGVCKGLIANKEYEWDIEYFEHIETTFRATIGFCYRCVEKWWNL